MKTLFSFFIGIGLLLAPTQVTLADVWVNGYTRSNGTYVQGHYRSSPDGNPYNNYSFPGNTNPYTGVTAGGSAASYLNNYNNSSSGSNYAQYYTSSYSYPTTPSCPANSYSSGSSCKCNYGYVVSGNSCVSGYSMCTSKYGVMSTYDSLSNSCKCLYGYEIGSTGLCTYKSSNSNSSYYSSSDYSYSSCPANSSESAFDSSKCLCDIGYQLNKKKTSCIKIPSKTNDKLCRAEFGSKSVWDGTYVEDSDNEPYCDCKKGYEWNTSETSCVKS
jgi:hypothetical protein